MSTYEIEMTYTQYATARVTLPDNRSWDDVAGWFIKWDELNLSFKDDPDKWVSIELNVDLGDSDTKRPIDTVIMQVDEDGHVKYERVVAEQ